MLHERLNAYRNMWLVVFFDLPVMSKKERKIATRFRKNLLKDGYTMMQYSVYMRHCASKESADVHIRRIRTFLPPKGVVSILRITDKQYGEMITYSGTKEKPQAPPPRQLELF